MSYSLKRGEVAFNQPNGILVAITTSENLERNTM